MTIASRAATERFDGATTVAASGERSHRRFENIDFLRGIAALLVLWQHAAEVFVALPAVAARGTGWYEVPDLLGFGRAGVVAFFAISGYVIVPTLRGERGRGTRDFAVKRMFRLYPPYWMSMALAAVTIWWLFDRPLSPAIVAANATMIPAEFGVPQMMGHYWTLEVELIFYLLVVGLFVRGRLHDGKLIASGLVVAAIVWQICFRFPWSRAILDHNLVWSFLAYFLAVMFWGAMVRDRQQRAAAADKRLRDWPFITVTTLVFGRPLLALAFGSATVNQEEWRGSLIGLILFLSFLRMPSRHARPFVWLGTISYSLYLLHPAVFYPIYHFVVSRPALSASWLPLYLLVAAAASIVAAMLGYRCVEAPSNAFARRLVARFDASATRPTS